MIWLIFDPNIQRIRILSLYFSWMKYLKIRKQDIWKRTNTRKGNSSVNNTRASTILSTIHMEQYFRTQKIDKIKIQCSVANELYFAKKHLWKPEKDQNIRKHSSRKKKYRYFSTIYFFFFYFPSIILCVRHSNSCPTSDLWHNVAGSCHG